MDKIRLGFALTGSFCTFERVLRVLRELSAEYDITPILSPAAASCDTRFGAAEDFRAELEAICRRRALTSLQEVEPIGPKRLLDILIVAPCTGNTLSKLAAGITDTCVTMACKSQLRNARPVVLAVSTNDGLSASASGLGKLLNRKNIYFVPFGQDAPEAKPTSLVADFSLIPETLAAAMMGKQLQPLLV